VTQPVTRIYLEPGVVALPEGAAGGGVDAGTTAPDALEALGHLADGAHELVVVGGEAPPALADLPWPIRTIPEIPEDPGPGSWFITDDPESCGQRPRGMRTILVGPRRAPTNRPAARCDVEARDLGAAVMEILAREAMS
jgi:hypothetical protein